jgi:hypothetical protein
MKKPPSGGGWVVETGMRLDYVGRRTVYAMAALVAVACAVLVIAD